MTSIGIMCLPAMYAEQLLHTALIGPLLAIAKLCCLGVRWQLLGRSKRLPSVAVE
jgi:hypothetical protein